MPAQKVRDVLKFHIFQELDKEHHAYFSEEKSFAILEQPENFLPEKVTFKTQPVARFGIVDLQKLLTKLETLEYDVFALQEFFYSGDRLYTILVHIGNTNVEFFKKEGDFPLGIKATKRNPKTGETRTSYACLAYTTPEDNIKQKALTLAQLLPTQQTLADAF